MSEALATAQSIAPPDLYLVYGDEPPRLAGGEPSQLTEVEERLLVLASLGGKVCEVADVMSISFDDVANTRDAVIEKFEVPNMAAAVNKAIMARYLPVTHEKNGRFPINNLERSILSLIAQGRTNGEISNRLQRKKPQLKQIQGRTFHRMGAGGRTHSVRRSYELGIFEIPEI